MTRKPTTTKRSVATQGRKPAPAVKPLPTQSLPSKALLDRFKREQLEAIDNRSMLISKREAIQAKAEAECELVDADIADLDMCISLFAGALDKADSIEVDKAMKPIPEFLSTPLWPDEQASDVRLTS